MTRCPQYGIETPMQDFTTQVGSRRLQILHDSIIGGFEMYPQEYSRVADAHHPRTRACIIHDHINDLAKRSLASCDGVYHSFSNERHLYAIDQKYLINFKKLDEQLLSSNYPTFTAQGFQSGEDLPGIPSGLTRVTVGYVPHADFTAINGIYAVKYDSFDSVEWDVDLISFINDLSGDDQQESNYGT